MISTLSSPRSITTTSSSPFARRTCFVLTLAEGVRLISLDTVRATRGLRAEEIIALAENRRSTAYLPAFDMSFAGDGNCDQRRLVHFWAGALDGTSNWRNLAPPAQWLEYIIADCLLTTVEALANPEINLHSSQLVRAWGLSHQSIRRLVRAGQLNGARVGRGWRVNRFSAAEFLRRRAL